VALPASIDTGCRSDLLTLDGEPLPVRLTGSTAGLLAGSTFAATGCTASGDAASLVVSGGAHHLVSAATGTSGLGIERVVLSDGRRATFRPPPTLRDISSSRGERRITVGPCPTGCWVITGDGANDGWEGSVDGQSLGPPATIDAGMAGWWLAPSREARTFTARWTPQRTIWIALVLSALAVVACAATVAAAAPALVSRRRGSVPRDAAGDTADSRETFAAGEAGAAGEPWTPTLPAAPVSGLLGRVPVPGPAARWWAPAVGALALGAVVAGPLWGVLAAAVTLVATRWQRPVLPGVVAVAIVAAVAAMYLGRQWRNRPGDGFGWVVSLEGAHRPTLLALVLLAAAVIPRPGRRR
jgi:arabinofuranan 3-O-arabinosyltransferase